MKKALLTLLITSVLVGCGGSTKSGDTDQDVVLPELTFNIEALQVSFKDDECTTDCISFVNGTKEFELSSRIVPEGYQVVEIEKRDGFSILTLTNDLDSQRRTYLADYNGSNFVDISEKEVFDIWFPSTVTNKTNHVIVNTPDGFEFYDSRLKLVGELVSIDNMNVNSDFPPLFTRNGIVVRTMYDVENQLSQYVRYGYDGVIKVHYGTEHIEPESLPVGISNDGDFMVFVDTINSRVKAVDIDNYLVNHFEFEQGGAVLHSSLRSNVGDYVFAWNNIIDLSSDFTSDNNHIYYTKNVCSDAHTSEPVTVFNTGGRFACVSSYDNVLIDGLEIIDPINEIKHPIINLPYSAEYKQIGETAISLLDVNGTHVLFDFTNLKTHSLPDNINAIIQ